MQRGNGELREEGSGVDSDLITMIGNEARECRQVGKKKHPVWMLAVNTNPWTLLSALLCNLFCRNCPGSPPSHLWNWMHTVKGLWGRFLCSPQVRVLFLPDLLEDFSEKHESKVWIRTIRSEMKKVTVLEACHFGQTVAPLRCSSGAVISTNSSCKW